MDLRREYGNWKCLERVALLSIVWVNANVVERAANLQSGKKRMGEYEGTIWVNPKSSHMSNPYMKASM